MTTTGSHRADHRRRSIRLKGYDYSQAGAYFVTLCSWRREPLFGQITEDAMCLNEWGKIVQSVWDGLPAHYPGMECDAFVVMPNHVHAIILLTGVGAGLRPAPTDPAGVRSAATDPAGTTSGPALSEIVRALKAFSARQINELRGTPGVPVWQRNYYEHIIRNARTLDRIRSYIEANPASWLLDWENPHRTGSDQLEGWLYGSRRG